MHKLVFPAALFFALSACHPTISTVGFPEPTVLKGEITKFTDDGFMMKDHTGTIEVDADGHDLGDMFKVGDTVTVKGVLDEDDSVGKDHVVAKEFDAYSVTCSKGHEIMVVPYAGKQKP